MTQETLDRANKLEDYEQKIMDLEQELDGEKQQHSDDIEDLKYFYNLLLDDYMTIVKDVGYYTDIHYTRKYWEEQIKNY